MGALASVALTLGVSEADAQNFNTGNGSTYAVPAGQQTNTINGLTVTGGTIRMRSSQGTITGKYGATKENRMPGMVIWYCKSTIPGGTFFTDLGTGGDGTVKVGPGEIDIAGDYKPGAGGEDPSNNGKREYPDGTNIKLTGNDPNKPQVIPGENGDNTTTGGFDVVTLEGGPKETPACGTGDVIIKQLVHNSGDLTNKGNLTLAHKAGSPHTAKNIINAVSAAGTCGITLKEDATITMDNYTNTSGFWTLEDNSNVNLTGAFTYTEGKMTFACNSNFHYMGTAAQTITGTPSNDETTGFFAYGNILFSQSDKTAGGDFRVCNDLKTESDVQLAAFTATLLNKTQANHVFFKIDAADDTNKEIIGNLRYENIAANQMLTYNNKDTKIQFEEAANLKFALNVQPNTQPDQMNDWDATKDVKRKVNATFEGTGKISHLEVSWKEGDETPGQFETPAPGSPIRFAEGYAPGAERKKIIRVGATYNNDVAARIVRYGKDGVANGILLSTEDPTAAPTNPNDLVTFNQKLFSGSDILLSTKTQKAVSIVNGRWSNPGTWDTGLEPASNDDVEIRTTVWVGDKTALFGGAAYEGDERAITNANATDGTQYAARSITIENVVGAGLYVNINDESLFKHTNNEIVFKTHMEGEADKVGIFNKNTNPESATPNTGSTTGMNGIFLSAVTGDHIPVLGAANWNNEGTFTNNGVAEVGTCLP